MIINNRIKTSTPSTLNLFNFVNRSLSILITEVLRLGQME